MPANTTPIFPKSIASAAVTFVAADTTALKTLFTADATNGSRIDNLTVSSDEVADATFSFYLSDGTTDFLIADLVVAAAITNINVLSKIKSASNGLFLKAGWSLKAGIDTNVEEAKTVTFIVAGGDY